MMPSSPEPTGPARAGVFGFREHRAALAAASAVVCASALAWRFAVPLVQHTEGTFTNQIEYLQTVCRLSILLVGTAAGSFLLVPFAAVVLSRSGAAWRRGPTWAVLVALCVFQWSFVMHAGRWQFGAFDAASLVLEGWRGVLGQRAYTDFLTSAPPLFILGIQYAYRVLGVTWDAGLYMAALFTCVSFLWLCWLLRGVGLSRFAAIATGFGIEAAAMLTLSFWWYNNTTMVLAAILFLSSLLYAERVGSLGAQSSYVVSLGLVLLTKPNMAGLTAVGCVAMLLVVCERRLRTMVLTLAGCVLAVVLLEVNHLSVAAILRSYQAVAAERGIGLIGFGQMDDFEQYTSLCWVPLLSLPILFLVPRLLRELRAGEWKGAARGVFFLLGPLIAAYGVATNGEALAVECTILLAAGAVVAFQRGFERPLVRRVYAAFLLAFLCGNLYSGAQRLRVRDIGPHTFFEWQDNENAIDLPFFRNIRVSLKLVQVERSIGAVMASSPGPFWFGPRLDFNNAVFRVPLPEHMPAWWHPGTAFSRDAVPGLLALWEGQRYGTLFFLRGDTPRDYIYYPPEFLDMIRRDYVADDRYPFLTVYHRRAEAGGAKVGPRPPR